MKLRTLSTEPSPTIEDICLQAVQHVEDLMAQIARGSNPLNDSGFAFDETQMLLEALPLNTDEFGLAANRLRNASRYLRSQELGAAGYELRLLVRSLTREGHHRNGRPSRQLSDRPM